MAERTPGPWSFRGVGIHGIDGGRFGIQAEPGRFIAVLGHGFDDEYDLPTTQANAAFIIRAANAHDALVEAAEAAYQELMKLPNAKTAVAYNLYQALALAKEAH